MSVSHTVPIIIAAGGKGQRLGGEKPAQILGGCSLIELAVRRATTMSPLVAIAVQGQPSWRTPEAVELLYDEQDDIGPLSALSSALKWGVAKQASHVLLIACDMPFLPPDILLRLTAATEQAMVVMAKSGVRLHPMCATWPTDALAELPEYAQTSRRSLIGFAERLGFVEVVWADEPVDPFFNINTPDDLAHAERLIISGAVSS